MSTTTAKVLPESAVTHLTLIAKSLNDGPAPRPDGDTGKWKYPILLETYLSIGKLLKLLTPEPESIGEGSIGEGVKVEVYRIVSRTIVTAKQPLFLIPIQITDGKPSMEPGQLELKIGQYILGPVGDYAFAPAFIYMVVVGFLPQVTTDHKAPTG